jgi:heptosyltransferase-2
MNTILVIRFSSMGDVILATTLFAHLRNTDPECRIHFITNRLYTELFRDDKRLEAVHPVAADTYDQTFAALAATRWHRIVDLQNNRRSRELCSRYFAGVPIGRFEKCHKERSILLYTGINCYNPITPVASRYIAAAQGKLPPGEPPPAMLSFANSAETSLGALFVENIERPCLVLIPFCAWKNKSWPLNSFCEVGRRFAHAGWNILILGGPIEQTPAAELAHAVGPAAKSVAGTKSLYEIGCLLQQTTLALGGDTGLTHLARACGVRTVILFGPTTRHFGFYPFGDPPFAVIERDLFCRPCHPHGGNYCWRLTRPCLRSISADSVIASLKTLAQQPPATPSP